MYLLSDGLRLDIIVVLATVHLLQHQLHLRKVYSPRTVLVVQVERKHDQSRLPQSTVVPKRNHELPEVDLPAPVLVEYSEDPLGELRPLQVEILQQLPSAYFAAEVLVDLRGVGEGVRAGK